MAREKRRWRRIIVATIAALLFIQALNLVMPARIAPVGPFNLAARAIIGAAALLKSAAEATALTIEKYFANADAIERLAILQEQHAQLQLEYQLTLQHVASRAALDELLGWTWLPWQGALGRIVFHDAADRYNTLWIQVPSGASVLGHAIVSPEGLLGRVIAQAGRYAHVLLLSDVESAVDAITPSGIRAMVLGTGGRRGKLDFVPRYEPLQNGERLISSGRDNAYPAGLEIGTVTNVTRSQEQLYLSAFVEFSADVAKAYWVRTLPPDTQLQKP